MKEHDFEYNAEINNQYSTKKLNPNLQIINIQKLFNFV